VSTGAIYHHYSSKEELAKEIHETAVQQFLSKYNLDVKSNDSSFEKVRAYIGMLFRWAEEDPVMVRYLIHGRPKEILEKPLSVCSEEGLSVLLEIINSGIEKEEIKVMNPFLAAAILSGSIVRMIDLRMDGLIDHPLVEYIESFANHVWLSLKA
jgi:AcrR family transcriptional regulator